jgi:hypothetical protein
LNHAITAQARGFFLNLPGVDDLRGLELVERRALLREHIKRAAPVLI